MGYELIKWSNVEYFEIIDLISLEWQPMMVLAIHPVIIC